MGYAGYGNSLGAGVGRFVSNERGVTGLETAIILIAFVVVAAVTAFGILGTGIFSSQQSRNTVHAGLSATLSSVVLRGGISVGDTDSDGNVDSLRFTLGTAAGGESVDLTQGITYVRYTDAFQKFDFDTSGEFSITPLGKTNGDNTLDEDETFEITLLNMETNIANNLVARRTFSLEIITRDGAVLHVTRTLPIRLNVWTPLEG
jgi:archaeal flagellin FlaB